MLQSVINETFEPTYMVEYVLLLYHWHICSGGGGLPTLALRNVVPLLGVGAQDTVCQVALPGVHKHNISLVGMASL